MSRTTHLIVNGATRQFLACSHEGPARVSLKIREVTCWPCRAAGVFVMLVRAAARVTKVDIAIVLGFGVLTLLRLYRGQSVGLPEVVSLLVVIAILVFERRPRRPRCSATLYSSGATVQRDRDGLVVMLEGTMKPAAADALSWPWWKWAIAVFVILFVMVPVGLFTALYVLLSILPVVSRILAVFGVRW